MGTQALYRRWRSRTFAEILGQDHITHTLLNALRHDRIAHAYLFSGPRGTGKTTTARVLAKAVNCLDPQEGEPCNRCAICRSLNEGRSLDLIEIDAASNRGIDEIRDLREKIAFSPSECRYKVYVVDEVHMLTNEAFNAILKTLEEPPPHAIFVLATTELSKIPATVLSRCQRFDFRRVSVANLEIKLRMICERESVRVEAPALDAIARYAAGSFRDAESLLDQLVSYGAEVLALEDVRRVLGSAPAEVVSGIVRAAISGDVCAGLGLIHEALDSGVEPRRLAREVLEYLRGVLLVKNGSASLLSVTPEALDEYTALAEGVALERLLATVRIFNEAANELKTGLHAQLPLEMALVEASLLAGPVESAVVAQVGSRDSDPNAALPREAAGEGLPVQKRDAPDVADAAPGPSQDEQAVAGIKAGAGVPARSLEPGPEVMPGANHQEGNASHVTLAWLQDNWAKLLRAIRSRNRMVEALLKSCEPVSVTDGLVTLGFYHTFHKERVGEDQHRVTVEEALLELSGQPLRVKGVLWEGDREEREQGKEARRREELLSNPVVHEAITNYGARVVDVR